MKKEAIKSLKKLLRQHGLAEDFYSRIRQKTGTFADNYLNCAQAMFAIRRIVNLYDGTRYANLAYEWDEKVIIERHSASMNQFADKIGIDKVISAVRSLQANGLWYIPHPDEYSYHAPASEYPFCQEGLPNKTPSVGLKVIANRPDIITKMETEKEREKNVKEEQKEQAKILTQQRKEQLKKFYAPPPKLQKQIDKLTAMKPLPTPTFVDNNEDNYEILDFSSSSHRTQQTDEYHIRVCNRKSGSFVAFNDYIAELAKTFENVFATFRVDRMLDKLYIVLTPKENKGSILCRYKGNILIAHNKKCVEYLTKRYNIQDENHILRVTKNLAHIEDTITIEILNQ